MAMIEEIGKLQFRIEELIQLNHKDWTELARRSMHIDERLGLRKAIAARNVELMELLVKKWELEKSK